MTDAFVQINKLLFNGINPYTFFKKNDYLQDCQGWNSHHAYLSDAIISDRPHIVVEVGVWKGGSTIHMAKTMQTNHVDGVIISVDTFLGSWEHYEQPEFFPSLSMKNGYPTLFYTFLTNVISQSVQNYVQPLPLDSSNAFFVLQRKAIQADVIHIDAGHDYNAVLNDLNMWWQLLRPGGLLIADDYDVDGLVWSSVRDAVHAFTAATPHEDFEAAPYKARFRKPRS